MVFLCAASVLRLNSSLYKFDVWQLKDLGAFHADAVAVRPALVVAGAGRRDLPSPISGSLFLLLSIITVSLGDPFHHNSNCIH